MSQQLISRSPDLKALMDDGYEVVIKSGHLILHNVPYVDAQKKLRRGTLVSTLDMADDVTVKPKKHVVMFAGEHPCDKNGCELKHLKHGVEHKEICEGVVVERSFSNKPPDGYENYHHKMATYAEMISVHAQAIDPEATARTYAVVESDDPEDVFNYIETASGRAGISSVSKKLEYLKIGIVGLGGTGSYVLDYVSKTHVREIHLFDGNDFFQHNAFRAPGAASSAELRSRPKKVEYFGGRYAPMRKGILAHTEYLDKDNVTLLNGLDFVFICIDNGEEKQAIFDKLDSDGIPFVDVGMGIELVDDKLLGILRVTTSTPMKRDHIAKRIQVGGSRANDPYDRNIQIAELNALNAAFAVVKWKKIFGVYLDLEGEHSSNYTLDGNEIDNTDKE